MKSVLLGKYKLHDAQAEISGGFVVREGEKYYRIAHYHRMPPFLVSIVSDADHWMFISSNGSLAAGRKDRDNALFPYYTDDKIHDYEGKTGSRTYFLVTRDEKTWLWEPFTDDSLRFCKVSRNIYKNFYGNRILFEEINESLGLSFSYDWSPSDRFGFVKRSSLSNISGQKVSVDLLDGLLNIVPHGVGYAFQNEYSNLADAYKKSELLEGTTLALFMLSAIPIDRAEPSEALYATTVWSAGLGEGVKVLISEGQVGRFRKGEPLEPESDVRAQRGAYFVNARMDLDADAGRQWLTIAEINQSTTAVANLRQFILSAKDPEERIMDDVRKGTEHLRSMVAMADGLQLTNTEVCYARHYTNVLFNIMRGGVPVDHYQVEKADYQRYLWQVNRLLSKSVQGWLDQLPARLAYPDLITRAEENGDPDLVRITAEYLPLTFSRRHGDPSRPWNRFSIETRNEDGSVKYHYEGNWRDIFQNWEALCYSFPEFTEGIISRFVNASTADGYNPYRITRDGIDWEVPVPDDPWSYIGYWGDHQIIYLQKLLELSDRFHPGKLDSMLSRELFTYANVPYRIRPFEEILRNPKDTVVFDGELNARIRTEAAYLGADACMLKANQGEGIYKVNLAEKILVTLLSKLSNLVPEAGIWMNTQRPEWNDANNALVGNGTSMVTLYYLRRFLRFWEARFRKVPFASVMLSGEVATLLENVHGFLDENASLLQGRFSDADRLRFATSLGRAHARYRQEVYQYSFSGEKEEVSVDRLLSFLRLCIRYIDQSIRVNRREDGLYHTYHLLTFLPEGIAIRPLYEMLEGQVAVLSSGYLSGEACLEVLDALKGSSMFRADQYSYMLYPDRQLPRFVEKNLVPEALVRSSALLTRLLADHDTSIIQQDTLGNYHFNSAFRNAGVLEQALGSLRHGSYSQIVEEGKDRVLAIYEQVFDHQSFTGRSGAFYGYEGLGSIYWHMVSKLLLATQECFFQAISEGAGPETVGRLKDHYYEIKAGIGLYKGPDLYGAFPMDAHSHTPAGAGAKQPGLTGQVKEDVISRLGELALTVVDGKILFDPALVNEEEVFDAAAVMEFYTRKGELRRIALKRGQMAFTFCNVPVVLSFDGPERIVVHFTDGSHEELEGRALDQRTSSMVFLRSGEVARLEATLNPGAGLWASLSASAKKQKRS